MHLFDNLDGKIMGVLILFPIRSIKYSSYFIKTNVPTDKDYYTNSFHYDVRKHPTPFEKLSFEMDYPKYAAGGFIHYCEYPNLMTTMNHWTLQRIS